MIEAAAIELHEEFPENSLEEIEEDKRGNIGKELKSGSDFDKTPLPQGLSHAHRMKDRCRSNSYFTSTFAP